MNDAQTIAESFCSAPVTPVYSEDESVFNWNVTQSKPNENDENKTSQEADRRVASQSLEKKLTTSPCDREKAPFKKRKKLLCENDGPPKQAKFEPLPDEPLSHNQSESDSGRLSSSSSYDNKRYNVFSEPREEAFRHTNHSSARSNSTSSNSTSNEKLIGSSLELRNDHGNLYFFLFCDVVFYKYM